MRKVYSIFIILSHSNSSNNLSAVLFEETETEHYSSVVVVIKERDSGSIEKFEDFRGKKACFPEFGGIGKEEGRKISFFFSISISQSNNFSIFSLLLAHSIDCIH